MFWKKVPQLPGEWDRRQAEKCRAAAKLAQEEGDIAHADLLESSAASYDKDALNAVRADREQRAGATPYSYSW